jgi:hypothetical protein
MVELLIDGDIENRFCARSNSVEPLPCVQPSAIIPLQRLLSTSYVLR